MDGALTREQVEKLLEDEPASSYLKQRIRAHDQAQRDEITRLLEENERLRTEKPYTESEVHAAVESHTKPLAEKITRLEEENDGLVEQLERASRKHLSTLARLAQVEQELERFKPEYAQVCEQRDAALARVAALEGALKEYAAAKADFDAKRLDDDYAWQERHERLKAAEQALLDAALDGGQPPAGGGR